MCRIKCNLSFTAAVLPGSYRFNTTLMQISHIKRALLKNTMHKILPHYTTIPWDNIPIAYIVGPLHQILLYPGIVYSCCNMQSINIVIFSRRNCFQSRADHQIVNNLNRCFFLLFCFPHNPTRVLSSDLVSFEL